MSENSRPQVSYALGFTRNMGNFESLRLDVGITDHAWDTEKVDDAVNRIKHYIESRLLDDLEDVERDILNLRKSLREEASYQKKVESAAKVEEAAEEEADK